jgi:hypothetical protein
MKYSHKPIKLNIRNPEVLHNIHDLSTKMWISPRSICSNMNRYASDLYAMTGVENP